MKNKIQRLGLMALLTLTFSGCEKESKNGEEQELKSLPVKKPDSTSDIVKTTPTIKDTTPNDTKSKLLEELKKIPVYEGYSVIGELKINTLKYKSYGFGDLPHYIFEDKNGKEYDFMMNKTDFELSELNEESEEVINKKYLNKYFTVVWRKVINENEAPDEMDYYEDLVSKELLYLKQVKK